MKPRWNARHASSESFREFDGNLQILALLPRTTRNIRKLADKSFALWKENPKHPSLHFKKLKNFKTLYSVRVGDHYRALGNVSGDSIEWVWIGSHKEYDDLVKRT